MRVSISSTISKNINGQSWSIMLRRCSTYWGASILLAGIYCGTHGERIIFVGTDENGQRKCTKLAINHQKWPFFASISPASFDPTAISPALDDGSLSMLTPAYIRII